MHANGDANSAPAAQAPASGSKARGTVYNVYAQPIDPKNQMPATANQQPSAGQTKPLSTERVQSSIPKGGTESTWLYPSPQMFWNALVRKNKAENVEEDDMDVVVKIHNEMNERAWRRLMEWEELHKGWVCLLRRLLRLRRKLFTICLPLSQLRRRSILPPRFLHLHRC